MRNKKPTTNQLENEVLELTIRLIISEAQRLCDSGYGKVKIGCIDKSYERTYENGHKNS